MAEPFLGEIRLFSFNFAPRGWAFCNGQLLPINQNQALFALLGTMYGGDGRVNFALPNALGRCLMSASTNYPQGAAVGEYAHTLTQSELPSHTHGLAVGGTGTTTHPANNYLGTPGVNARLQAFYGTTVQGQAAPTAITPTGGSQPHNNQQPYLVLNYCIALQGIFPSRN